MMNWCRKECNNGFMTQFLLAFVNALKKLLNLNLDKLDRVSGDRFYDI
jgi:hypothetical protein